MAVLTRPIMADRGQEVAAAWPPRARLGLTAPRAGRLEVDDALLPLHSPARALPSFTPPLPSPFTAEVQQHTADAIGPAELARARRGTTATTVPTIAPLSPHGPRQHPR